MQVLAVIPARFGSKRFPGKPLADLNGKPLIQWVYERTLGAPGVNDVIVATDDERIKNVVCGFGGRAILTPENLRCGTDRVAFVAQTLSENYEIIVNVQGDEPLIEGEIISQAIAVVRDGGFDIGTLMTPLKNEDDLNNPNVVKVITTTVSGQKIGRAIYFSRFPIPYSRGGANKKEYISRRHLGIYVYRRAALLEFSRLPSSLLEGAESLEQLRVLEAGFNIGVKEVFVECLGVDTPEDLEIVSRKLNKKH